MPSGFTPLGYGISVACLCSMMTTLFIFTAVAAVGLFTEIIAASNAPLGYQDETGFHLGSEFISKQSLDLENPS